MYKGHPFSRTTYYRRKRIADELGCDIEDVVITDNRGRHGNHTKGDAHHRKAKAGDEYISSGGHVRVFVGSNHCLADKNGHVYQHILRWYEKFGYAPPTGCVIHHINGDKRDNRIENLEVLTRSEHNRHHNKDKKRDLLGRWCVRGVSK